MSSPSPPNISPRAKARLPPNAQLPRAATVTPTPRAIRSPSGSMPRSISLATEALASSSPPPAGFDHIARARGGLADIEDEYSTAATPARSVMILPRAEAARRLRRHLVTRPADSSPALGSQPRSYGSVGYSDTEANGGYSGDDDNDDENIYMGATRDDVVVDPFTLPSGDITHQLYKWQEEHARAEAGGSPSSRNRHNRTRSFSVAPSDSEWDVTYTPYHILAPGGFRRQFVHDRAERQGRPANILTANFVDFIGLYGHFAGGSYPSDEDDEEDVEGEEEGPEIPGLPPTERVRLIRAAKRQEARDIKATASPQKAFFLLVKSFVGTGVLVLPRAFLNGGLIFSTILMSAIAWYALHCMIMLSDVYLKLGGSYGDLALKLYGRPLKYCVMVSIVLAQLGFCCAYVIFVATNMRDLWNTITECQHQYPTEMWILFQLLIYIPLAFVRKIKKFASLSLVGNFFILIGLGYLFVYDLWSIATRGPAKVVQFNPSKFPLLVGTAAFSYEGISLVIPIVESMERKDKFNGVLTASLVICAGLFVIIGALSYLTFGEAVEAVILLNLPNDSVWTLSVQFLYSLAIIMSVPLQLFPAIRIIESGLFTQSGKGNPVVKWQKNLFRTLMVGFIAMVAIFGADKLDNFIAIVGASSCLPLSFLYPVMLHYRSLADTWRAKAKDVVLIAIALFGLVWQWLGTSDSSSLLVTHSATECRLINTHSERSMHRMNSSRIPSHDGMQPQVSADFAHWHDDPQGQAAAASVVHLQSTHLHESAMAPSPLQPQPAPQPQVPAVVAHWHDDPQGQAAAASVVHLQSTHVHESAMAPFPLQPQPAPQPQVPAVVAHWHDDPQGQAAAASVVHLQSTHVHESAMAPFPLQPQPAPQPQVPAVVAHWHDDPHGQAAGAVSFLAGQHEGASDFAPQHDLGALAGAAVVPQLAHEQFTHSHLSPHLHVLQLAVAGQVHDVTPSWVQVHVLESHSPLQLH
ncbi:hypothetical protein GGI19_000939 [Coemansia pectinata]|uniref:Amino acid transporter transmembrane domain-containing protein n=1 Tax=Coemansia pectinata TaxID=1052879 RepID=A0A9W8GYI7_9FUNG|nr:hypothetical protein GGI19_000939 [Coemansia pectinata]